MRKRSARKRRAEAGPPLVPDPREEIGGEEVDVGTLGLGFVGAGFAGIREIGVGVRTAEGERRSPSLFVLSEPEKRERKWYLCHYLNIISGAECTFDRSCCKSMRLHERSSQEESLYSTGLSFFTPEMISDLRYLYVSLVRRGHHQTRRHPRETQAVDGGGPTSSLPLTLGNSEGHDAYHFSLQLTGAPALIGNTICI
ncbi:hypothetical protein Bca4012_008093 [Brassica carinata]